MGVDDQRRDRERESEASTQVYTTLKHTLHIVDDEIRKKKCLVITQREKGRERLEKVDGCDRSVERLKLFRIKSNL